MKRDVSFDLLHGLVDVPVQDREGAEFFQVGQGLGTVFGAPTPFGVNGPQRNVREHHDGSAVFQMLYIIFEPLQLFVAQRSQSTRLKVHDVHQPNEMHAFLVEAVPARALAAFGEAVQEVFSVVVQDVMFAGDIENVLRLGSFQNLLDGIEFLRFRKMTDVAGV